jgi:Raf kinase inhibitor-like YbhB/YbcL family protein
MLSVLLLTVPLTKGGYAMSFKIMSHDFKDGDTIPRMFSCDGDDLSPELKWDDPPEGTKSFALIVEDPDAPVGTFTHWIVYDMPPTFKELYRGMGNDADLKEVIKEGITDFGHRGYGGPCPPKGHGRHHYNFILKALDVPTLGLPDAAKKGAIEKAMKGHVLGETRITGVYGR